MSASPARVVFVLSFVLAAACGSTAPGTPLADGGANLTCPLPPLTTCTVTLRRGTTGTTCP